MSTGFRRAKIVATVGPASRGPAAYARLVDAGIDAIRINFSHTSHEEAAQIVAMVRDTVRASGRPVAVVGDLQGPRIRVGDLAEPLEIESERDYCFVPEGYEAPTACEPHRVIPTTYPELVEEVKPGNRILLDDGRLEFVVHDTQDHYVMARSRAAGSLGSQKGMNLPGIQVGAPSLSEKDRQDLEFARGQRFDYMALSFVRRAEDVEAARAEVDSGTLLIAKIEKAQAVEGLDTILPASDGVMVARGDLGVELPYEEVPMTQKRIIRLARERARPVITATQMLESMTRDPRPTRAEVSDVANALLDGTDAVMLSAETAIGRYPVEAVETMDRIIRRIESDRYGRFYEPTRRSDTLADVQQSTSGAVAAAAMQAVDRLGSPFVVTFTRSGYTARVVAAQRPNVPILAVSDQWRTFNQLALVWGVVPVLFRGEVSYQSMLSSAKEAALEQGLGQPGHLFVVTAGVPFHVAGTTNMMRIEEL
jgi:pyruvate kinase